MKTCRTNTKPWCAAAAMALICTTGVWAQSLTSSGQHGEFLRSERGASCGGTPITQNTNPDLITDGTVQCAAGGITTDNFFARSYTIAATTSINCVDFAIETTTGPAGGNWPARVRIYRDTNGGAPNVANLVQLAETFVSVPNGSNQIFVTANFAGGVPVIAGETIVVELFTACRQTTCTANPPGFPAAGDGGSFWFGSNAAGQSAPSYIMAPACGLNDYATLASIGFPNVHIIQLLGTGDPPNPCTLPLPDCSADVAPVGGDDLVNVADLLAVINTWGQNGNPNGPRPQGDTAPLPNGDCVVNVSDLLRVINTWGACPQPMGACCMPNGSCVANQTQTQCVNAGGVYQGNNSQCGSIVCPVAPANDNCSGAIAVGNGTHNITNNNATNGSVPGASCTFGGPQNFTRDVWYSYTATCTGNLVVEMCATTGSVTDTVIAAYTGTCTNLTEVGCDDDSCPQSGSLLSRMVVPVTSGNSYFIRVGTWGTAAANQGAMVMTISCTAFNNDFCAEATPIAVGGSASGTLATATQDAAPICNGVSAGLGRWFTVMGNGNTLTVSTCNSPNTGFWDLRLSVYCGGGCSSLVCVAASNSDNCSGGTHPLAETVSFCSLNGQQYWILVHTDSGGNAFNVSVTNGPACNNPVACSVPLDDCSGAVDITANINGAPVNGDNSNATPPSGTDDPDLPPGSPTCHWNGTPDAVHNTHWYKFTANSTGIMIQTCNSTTPFTDSVLTLYSGTCGNLTQIGCGEDECAGTQYYSQINLTSGLTVGQTYYVMVGSTGAWAGSVPGPYVLNIAHPTPPCDVTCPAGSEPEGEPCLADGATDTTNGGCNSTPTVYGTITANGPAKCGKGSTRLNGATQTRDTDWYRFTAAAGGQYRMEFAAEFAGLTGIVTGLGAVGSPCSGAAFVTGSTLTVPADCVAAQSPPVTLTAGQAYAVFAGPSVFTGWPCEPNRNDYWVRLIQQ